MTYENQTFVLHPVENLSQQATIKVLGIGGGGTNAVDYMVKEQIESVEFYVANTDAQALGRTQVLHKIQFGNNLTKGLGAGSDPNIGRDAAIEDIEKIKESLVEADMLFITAGMGGGTGTGAAPVIAKAIKDANPETLVVAVVTTPFEFEGVQRMIQAEKGLAELKDQVDSLITVPNEKILQVCGQISVKDAYGQGNDILLNAVKGISDLVIKTGFINVDFADVRTVMSEAGLAMMGTGRSSGERSGESAIENAIQNPLLADIDVSNAKGLLINVTASSNMPIPELQAIGAKVRSIASDDATIIMGQVFDDTVGDEIRVTIVATGIDANEAEDEFALESEFNPVPNGDDDEQAIEDQESAPIFDGEMSNPEIPAIIRRRYVRSSEDAGDYPAPGM